jgi:hypothetical protein
MQHQLQQIPFKIIKEFSGDVLKVSNNMTIVFTHYPAMSIEYRNEKYHLNIKYCTAEGVAFDSINQILSILIEHDCPKRNILRIELNSFNSTAVLYGPLYEYEKIHQANHQSIPLGNVLVWK